MELHDHDMSADSDEAEIFQPPRFEREELPPPDVFDPVIEAYKKDVDRTLLIENLKLTPAQRAEKFVDFMKFLDEINRAAPLLDANGAPKNLKATAELYKILAERRKTSGNDPLS